MQEQEHIRLLRHAVQLAHDNRLRGGRPFGALLARANPIATIPAALLVGTLRAGSSSLQFQTGIEPEVVSVILALTLLFVSAPIVAKLLFRNRSIRQTTVTKGWGA